LRERLGRDAASIEVEREGVVAAVDHHGDVRQRVDGKTDGGAGACFSGITPRAEGEDYRVVG
jgi:hypothetical protein